MMAKAPAFQFYTGDWMQDTRCLSLAAKGAWIDLLCAMWRSQTRGMLTLPLQGYARLIGATVDQTKVVIDELIDMRICDRGENGNGQCNDDVTLINRRMAREERERELTRCRVERHRNAQMKRESNGDCNADVTGSSSSSSSSSKKKKERKVLSDDEWLKTLEDNPIYEGLEVKVLYGKMIVWCQNNGKKPTRRRFVNWLNREDKPLKSMNGKPEAPKGKPTQQCQKCGKMFYHLIRVREMNLCQTCAETI